MSDRSGWNIGLWSASGSRQTIRKWRMLLRFGNAVLRNAGARLFDKDSSVRRIYLLEDGIVKLTSNDHDTHTPTILLRFPGDLIGSYAALLRVPHWVSATAVIDCLVAEVSTETALQTLATTAEAAYFLAERQTADALRTTVWLLQTRTLTAEQRLFRLLLELTHVKGVADTSGYIALKVPLKDSDIADLIAVSHKSFSRLKRGLIRQNLLHQDGAFVSFDPRVARTRGKL